MTSLPAAMVRIRLRSVELGPEISERVRLAKRPYLLAFIGQRRFGRSRQVAESGIDLDLEPMRWEREIRVTGGEFVPVILVLHDEASDVPLGSTSAMVGPPWSSGSRSHEGEISFSFDVTSRRIPDRRRVAPRSAAGTTTFATLRLGNTSLVEITEIRGLHRPLDNPGLGAPPAVPIAGYLGEDDRGRVYLNRDLDCLYSKDMQILELTVRIHVLSGRLPPDCRIRWTAIDVDDPSNDDPEVHPEAGIQLDPLDYAPSGEHEGSAGGDNRAQPDAEGRWADGRSVWSAVDFYGVTVVSGKEATTPVVGGISKIAYGCPDRAGDTFVLRAEILAPDVESFAAETGILTMWHLIDIEYIRMESARSMQLPRVLRAFASGFIEARFTVPRIVPDVPYVGRTYDEGERGSLPLVRQLGHRTGQGGWFVYLEALQAHPLPPKTEPYEGEVPIDTASGHDAITVKRAFENASWAEFQWESTRSGEPPLKVSFSSVKTTVADGVTRMHLQSHLLLPLFSPGWVPGPFHFFRARHQDTGAGVREGGYGIPTGFVQTTVGARGSGLLGVGGAGMLVAYTRAYSDAPKWTPQAILDDIDISVVHELTHAFGLTHICGRWDRRVPRTMDEAPTGPRRQSCLMNYSDHWILASGPPFDTLEPNTQELVGLDYCARHIDCLRDTHLEDDKNLGWK